MRRAPIALTLTLLLAPGAGARGGLAQAPSEGREVTLPRPTGPSPVGTVVWHWIDGERPDQLTADPDDVREIMAQAWYPAAPDSGSAAAPYAPLYPSLGHVRAWSHPGAAVEATARPLAIVVLAPGRGVARHYYTAVGEDLASHGFFVLAIDSPHSGRVVYPSGRSVTPNPRYRIPFEVLTGPYEHVDEFFREAAQLGAGDIAFALRRLAQINRADPAGRLTASLDLSRLGAFGHSLGGRIAGAAVAAEARFVAYASMEGVPPRDARRRGMDAAVLMLVSSDLPDMAQPNIREVIPERRNDVYIATLQGFGHNSVTDLPQLYPEEYAYAVDPALATRTARDLLRRFFDQYLRGGRESVAAAGSEGLVEIEVFERP